MSTPSSWACTPASWKGLGSAVQQYLLHIARARFFRSSSVSFVQVCMAQGGGRVRRRLRIFKRAMVGVGVKEQGQKIVGKWVCTTRAKVLQQGFAPLTCLRFHPDGPFCFCCLLDH